MNFLSWLWSQILPNLIASGIAWGIGAIWHLKRIQRLLQEQRKHLESELKTHRNLMGMGDN